MHIKMNNFIFGEHIDKPCVDLERVPRKFKLSEFPYQIINITENRPLNTRPPPPHTNTHHHHMQALLPIKCTHILCLRVGGYTQAGWAALCSPW